jgi:hypothetical protein
MATYVDGNESAALAGGYPYVGDRMHAIDGGTNLRVVGDRYVCAHTVAAHGRVSAV